MEMLKPLKTDMFTLRREKMKPCGLNEVCYFLINENVKEDEGEEKHLLHLLKRWEGKLKPGKHGTAAVMAGWGAGGSSIGQSSGSTTRGDSC